MCSKEVSQSSGRVYSTLPNSNRMAATTYIIWTYGVNFVHAKINGTDKIYAYKVIIKNVETGLPYGLYG